MGPSIYLLVAVLLLASGVAASSAARKAGRDKDLWFLYGIVVPGISVLQARRLESPGGPRLSFEARVNLHGLASRDLGGSAGGPRTDWGLVLDFGDASFGAVMEHISPTDEPGTGGLARFLIPEAEGAGSMIREGARFDVVRRRRVLMKKTPILTVLGEGEVVRMNDGVSQD